MQFLINNKEYIIFGIGVILGFFIPLVKVHAFGRTVGSKLPKKTREQLADYINAFEQGLRNKEYLGSKDVVSNNQLSESTNELKMNLGLEPQLKEKALK